MTPSAKQPSVAVAGGGLAGLAAACALADAGFRVTLLERRPYLGGRASSYEHPGTGEIVDNCQHVLLGCCTNLIDFYRRTGAEEKIRWYDELVFREPGGRASYIKPSFLPAPLHTGPSFLRAACLGWRDKLAIARAMMVLSGILGDEQADPFLVRQEGRLAPRDSGQSFLQWLEQHGQTEPAIDRFWKTILVSALNEDLDRMSLPYAAQVVRESFLKSPAAGRMGVPTVPLTDLYNAAGNYIHEHGGELRVRCSLETFRADRDQIHVQVSSKDVGTSEEVFDYLVLALPFDGVDRVLPTVPEATPLREMLTHFESSPITGIHLWFDRQISELDHAVLLDRTIQWMFHKSRLQPMRTQGGKKSARDSDAPYSETNREGHEFTRAASASSSEAASAAEVGSYVELVVSSSKSLIDRSRPEIIELALRELREFFPEAKAAQLVKSTVIKELHATYSPRPGIDAYRPGAATAWPRVFLAGDWTNTGWPATMEGAVRSGYMAAEALARASGAARSKFLMPDLPATGLMRLLT